MAAERSDAVDPSDATILRGRSVKLVGRFATAPRGDIAEAVRRRGGKIVDEGHDLVVLGEIACDDRRGASDSLVESWTESELWRRLGLVDPDEEFRQLYSPAMLADLVGVPVGAVRQWARRGLLPAVCRVNQLAYFGFNEARAAQTLAEVQCQGASLSSIHRMVGDLAASFPSTNHPLIDLPVAAVDGKLMVRHGETLTEATGQRLLAYDDTDGADEEFDDDEIKSVILFDDERWGEQATSLREAAWEHGDRGDFKAAIDSWRLVMLEAEPTAEDHFVLAEWLYQDGRLDAATERYYVALEVDPEHLEARVGLGCLLAEQGETRLAEAALRGALEQHPDYADALYHLAAVLDRAGDGDEAASCWRRFLEVAPDSPWAERAERRLEECRPGSEPARR